MAINYEDITQAIVDLLQDAIPGSNVLMEPIEVGSVDASEIGVSYAGEENVEVSIGDPDPYETTLRYSILCSEYSPDGLKEAKKQIWTQINNIRQAIKTDTNRNLNGKVGVHRLGSVNPQYVEGEEQGFWAAAYIEMLVTLKA